MNSDTSLNTAGKRTILRNFIWLIIQTFIFFLVAQTITYIRAWIHFGIGFFGSIFNGYIFWKYLPELANRRGETQPNAKKWDNILISTYFVCQLIVIPIIAGFDIRYDWLALPFSSVYLGIFFYILSFIIIQWSLIVNKFFEGQVRIQADQNHFVVNTGPYKLIRHPGYFGMIFGGVATPLIIGSAIALIAYGIPTILLVVRTYFEDKTLQEELAGYKEYSAQVKYRLIPFIW